MTLYNARPQSGECYYVLGQIYESLGEYKTAYDSYFKAAYAADCVAKSMTRIAVLDLRAKDYLKSQSHALWALDYGRKNSLATACLVISKRALGSEDEAEKISSDYLSFDPLDHLVRYVSNKKDFYSLLLSNPAATCLDLASDLNDMGRYRDVLKLLKNLIYEKPESITKMVCLATAYFSNKLGEDANKYIKMAETAEIGADYPSRSFEALVLKSFADQGSLECKMLLGCMLYHNQHYQTAAELFESSAEASYIAKRNLAVAYFSHLNRPNDALKLMYELCNTKKGDEQILYETLILMNKMNIPAEEKIKLLLSAKTCRDDLFTELAKAYNQCGKHQKAIEVLLSHVFVPCEGGEHAVADQYIFAHLSLGIGCFKIGEYEKALIYFLEGQTLPESLGAGIWNHCKLIPLKYREALCLDMLGRKREAEEIYRYIANTEIDYFSNMHLPELPYYKDLAHDKLGEGLKSRALITEYRRAWNKMEGVTDNGFFATTPFFISFIDAPERLRRSKFLYLTALLDRYEGNGMSADKKLAESYALNNDNLFALVM